MVIVAQYSLSLLGHTNNTGSASRLVGLPATPTVVEIRVALDSLGRVHADYSDPTYLSIIDQALAINTDETTISALLQPEVQMTLLQFRTAIASLSVPGFMMVRDI